MDPLQIEKKTAREFESALFQSDSLLQEVASRVQARFKQIHFKMATLKMVLRATNKRNYCDFLEARISYAQFKKRVLLQKAKERGKSLNYTLLDELRGEIDDQYLDRTPGDELLLGKFKRQLKQERHGKQSSGDLSDKEDNESLNIPCQKRCLRSLLKREPALPRNTRSLS